MSCALGRYITELHKLIPRSDLNWIRRRTCWTNTDSDLKLKPIAPDRRPQYYVFLPHVHKEAIHLQINNPGHLFIETY